MEEEKKLIDETDIEEGSFEKFKLMTIYDIMFYITGIPKEIKMKLTQIKVRNKCEHLMELYNDFNWNLLLQVIENDDTDYAETPKVEQTEKSETIENYKID
jgi:hypothetical protein